MPSCFMESTPTPAASLSVSPSTHASRPFLHLLAETILSYVISELLAKVQKVLSMLYLI